MHSVSPAKDYNDNDDQTELKQSNYFFVETRDDSKLGIMCANKKKGKTSENNHSDNF